MLIHLKALTVVCVGTTDLDVVHAITSPYIVYMYSTPRRRVCPRPC